MAAFMCDTSGNAPLGNAEVSVSLNTNDHIGRLSRYPTFLAMWYTGPELHRRRRSERRLAVRASAKYAKAKAADGWEA